jgi:ABC-2 type transport system ATP-binding protein
MDRGVFVKRLRKTFQQLTALDGLDLVVPQGSVGAVLGPNGAGKTTLIRILSTLDTADAGTAFVGGHSVAADPHSVRSVIALTGQYAAVDADLTGRQNLAMIGRLYRLSGPAARRRADELLDRFGLTAAAGRLVRTYSGGMRRRLDLAASLVIQPSVLFLDEPTTGLDPPSREELWAVVRTLRQSGTTIVLTTQYLEEADRLADHVTVVDRGRAVAQGSPAELKAAVGGDIFEVRSLDREGAAQAAHFLASRARALPGAVTVDPQQAMAHVSVPSGSFSLTAAVRLLDAEGLPVEDIHLRRATLDEVFSALTRRR